MEFTVSFKDSFKKIVKSCLESKAYLGSGNPNAEILVVGQESANETPEPWYIANASDWNNIIADGKEFITHGSAKKFPAGHTWSKYQKLHDYVYPEYYSGGNVNFEERIFTTEMSDNPAKRNSLAKKNGAFVADLLNRKTTFFREDFIQDFSVVVLACSGYIVNDDETREIDEIFKVSYAGDEFGKYTDYSKGNWFYLHYNDEKTRLVIHTRQLSTNVDNKLLEDMGRIIRDHLISVGK